jgi:hypothetical protein
VIIEEIIERREITEVLHFTTHRGLLGALYSGAVKSRKRLPAEVDLQYIYQPNANFRKDHAWLDYVNLSISRINNEFFRTSCRWHRAEDLWWCIMSFDPVTMTHDGVYFATTNNMYTGVSRGKGPVSLESLFAQRVIRWSGNIAVRGSDLPNDSTTCVQAEMLYPGEISMKYLRRIYVVRAEDMDEVHAQLAMTGFQAVDVLVMPEKFA